jgi:hypothetical protein
MRSEDRGREPRTTMHEAAEAPQHDAPSPPANPDQANPDQARAGEARGPQYRLRGAHLLEGRIVPAGTIVGAGTGYPLNDDQPSNAMEGANEAGRAKVNELHQRLYGADAPWHDERRQRDVQKDLEEQKKQRDEEKNSEPVSHAQAVERGREWKGPPEPMMAARLSGAPVPGAPPITGDRAGGPGVAVPRIPQEQPRVEKPLEEQLPKIG